VAVYVFRMTFWPIRKHSVATQPPAHIWHNGTIKPWAEATVHVMAHALHYGSSIFEGIRSYPTPDGVVIFRLTDHLKRLFNSARIYDMPMPYDRGVLTGACRDVVRLNNLKKAYIRPVVFRGAGQGLSLAAETTADVAVGAWELGNYLGTGAVETALMPVFRAGNVRPPIRFLWAPKPAAITCLGSSSREKPGVLGSAKASHWPVTVCSVKAPVKTCF